MREHCCRKNIGDERELLQKVYVMKESCCRKNVCNEGQLLAVSERVCNEGRLLAVSERVFAMKGGCWLFQKECVQ